MLRIFVSIAALLCAYVAVAIAQDEKKPIQILFTNANVFDGFSPDLIKGANVLVEDNIITQVSTDAIDAPDAFVVDVGGRVMTPGLIDMHTHSMF
ncbi:MAG: hypothetical protein ACR2O0_09435, partial [Rhizobiaceae bacterium]